MPTVSLSVRSSLCLPGWVSCSGDRGQQGRSCAQVPRWSRLPSHTPSCSRWESWEHRSPPGPSPGKRCPPRHEGRVSAPPAGSCRAALTASDPSPACGGTRPGHRPTEGGRAEQSFWLSADHTNPRLRDRPRKGCRPWNVRPRASAAPAALTLRGSRQGSCAEGRPPHHFR